MKSGLKDEKNIRVLVCGGRDYDNKLAVFGILGTTHETLAIQAVIHGDATGADSFADQWARKNKVDVICCPADWEAYGKAAGPIRNSEMLQYEPDLVMAFPGGKGTGNMIAKAKKEGIPVI